MAHLFKHSMIILGQLVENGLKNFIKFSKKLSKNPKGAQIKFVWCGIFVFPMLLGFQIGLTSFPISFGSCLTHSEMTIVWLKMVIFSQNSPKSPLKSEKLKGHQLWSIKTSYWVKFFCYFALKLWKVFAFLAFLADWNKICA